MTTEENSKNFITANYSWVPFHVVSVSSEEYNCYADNLSDHSKPTKEGYESQKLGEYPVEMVIRFHYRVELDYVIISSKSGKSIPRIEFLIGDGLGGNYNDVEYRVAGAFDGVLDSPTQVKCFGVGSYLKLHMPEKPGRSKNNPYAQISIRMLKIWGRLTGYETKIQNKALDLKNERTRMNKILLEMGVPSEILNYYEKGNLDANSMPIDDATKETLVDMRTLREEYMDKEDFEGLKQITLDIRKVERIGRKIFDLQKELEFVVAKQNYDKAIELKELVKKEASKRDKFDAIYETRRYVRMIEMVRPNTTDFNNSIFIGDKGIDEDNAKKEMDKTIDDERSKLGLSGLNDDTMISQNSNLKTPRSILKNSSFNRPKKIEEEDESKFDRNRNPLERNSGDDDLEPYFKPLLIQSKGKIPEIGIENLNRLHQLGLLEVFGVGVWKSIYSSDWRIRRAAAQAVLNFIEMPLIAKYIGKTKNLFLACIELARIICQDKILEIYFIGLRILTTCLAPPVCGDDIQPAIVNKVLTEFAPILIEKISELNFKARDVSLHTLLTIFQHQSVSLQVLIEACMDLCETERDYMLYGKSQKIPIEKQQPRLLIARLEIVLQVLTEFGYDQTLWNFREAFDLLLIPCLFHPSIDVRTEAIEVILMLYQLIGDEIRDTIFSVKGLKPQIYDQLAVRMDELEEYVAQNLANKDDKKLEEIKEEDEEEDVDDVTIGASKKSKKPGSKKEKKKRSKSKGGDSAKSSKSKKSKKSKRSKSKGGDSAKSSKSKKSKKSKRSKSKGGDDESKKSKRSKSKGDKSDRSKKSKKSKKSKGRKRSESKGDKSSRSKKSKKSKRSKSKGGDDAKSSKSKKSKKSSKSKGRKRSESKGDKSSRSKKSKKSKKSKRGDDSKSQVSKRSKRSKKSKKSKKGDDSKSQKSKKSKRSKSSKKKKKSKKKSSDNDF